MKEKNCEWKKKTKKTDRILLDQNGVSDYIFTYKQRKKMTDQLCHHSIIANQIRKM